MSALDEVATTLFLLAGFAFASLFGGMYVGAAADGERSELRTIGAIGATAGAVALIVGFVLAWFLWKSGA